MVGFHRFSSQGKDMLKWDQGQIPQCMHPILRLLADLATTMQSLMDLQQDQADIQLVEILLEDMVTLLVAKVELMAVVDIHLKEGVPNMVQEAVVPGGSEAQIIPTVPHMGHLVLDVAQMWIATNNNTIGSSNASLLLPIW